MTEIYTYPRGHVLTGSDHAFAEAEYHRRLRAGEPTATWEAYVTACLHRQKAAHRVDTLTAELQRLQRLADDLAAARAQATSGQEASASLRHLAREIEATRQDTAPPDQES